MDELNLIELRKAKSEKLTKLNLLIQAENRKFSEIEENYIATTEKEIENLDKELTEVRKNTSNNHIFVKPEVQDKFSLRNYLLNICENRNFNDIEKEVRDKGNELFKNSGMAPKGYTLPLKWESRTLTAGTTNSGSELIATDKINLLLPLHDQLVLTQAGATMFTNMSSNIGIVTMSGTSATWKGEVVTADQGQYWFTEKDFSPKRLTSYISISKQLLISDSLDVEKYLQQELIDSIKGKLESTFLGTAAGSTTQPEGLFYNATYSASGTTDWTKIITMETNVAVGNCDVSNMSYIITPTLLGKLKYTAKASNTAAFIADGGEINGYKYFRTNALPTISGGTGLLFGDFSKFYVIQFGALDITYDSITSAKDGVVNYIINSYWDGGLVRPSSITKGWLS